MPRESKTFPLAELKIDGADGSGTFDGRASTFGAVDSYGDAVDPGAYRDTIPQFLSRGFIGWGHDWNEPIGIVTAAEERGDGLYVSGQFHSDAEAQKYRLRARERVEAGKFMGLSIGFEAEAWEMRKVETPVRGMWGELTDRVRALTRIKLYEVSLVTVPAESGSGVTGIKSLPLREQIAHASRDVQAVTALVKSLLSGLPTGEHLTDAKRQELSALLETFSGVAAVRADLERVLAGAAKSADADPFALLAQWQRVQAQLSGHLEHARP